jgi:uncharacterized phage-associated protein
MQVIKLVYIAHGWMLGLHGRPLIKDDVEAWKFGPVIPALYGQLAKYRGDPVADPLVEPRDDTLSDIESDLVAQVFDRYGKMSGTTLSSLTHRKGTPWARTWGPDGWATKIPNDMIQEHYEALAQQAGQNG